MVNNYAFYPQLLHWMLSFFSTPRALLIGKYSSVVFHLLSGAALYGFAIILYPYLSLHFSLHEFLLYVGLLYASTPYHYDMENAKNLNISARGIGLFLGQVFTYAIVLYSLNDQLPVLGVAVVAATLIFMSSQFAIQYVLFSTPLLAALFAKPLLLVIPVLGVLPFFILMPKVAYLSFKGQLNHKRVYVRYLAKKYILEIRYSIWRDWVFDFWILFFSKRSRLSFTKKLGYVITNPLVIVLFSMPFLLPLVLDIGVHYYDADSTGIIGKSYSILVPLGVGALIFLATSFRATRFLGEPERYIEFSIGLLAIAVAVSFKFDHFTQVVVVLSVFLILARYYLYVTQVLKRRNKKFSNTLEVIKERLLKISNEKEIRLLCNNTFACKTFFHRNINLFWVTLVSETTGNFHFEEIFKDSYSFIHEDVIAPITKEFQINYLVIDLEAVPDIQAILNAHGVHVNRLEIYDTYELYEVV